MKRRDMKSSTMITITTVRNLAAVNVMRRKRKFFKTSWISILYAKNPTFAPEGGSRYLTMESLKMMGKLTVTVMGKLMVMGKVMVMGVTRRQKYRKRNKNKTWRCRKMRMKACICKN